MISLHDVERKAPDLMEIKVLCDARNLTDAVGEDCGNVQDKRLRIVVAMLREATAQCERASVLWIETWR
eukprot:1678754-Lingulodinium_polyedra.AAC.1